MTASLTDRPFYSLGFEVGAKNWYISRVQHRLNNFGPFAKVLAVDGQTWHSLQSDMHDRSLCGVSTNLFLDESAGPQATFPWMNSFIFFLVVFCPLMKWGTRFWTNWWRYELLRPRRLKHPEVKSQQMAFTQSPSLSNNPKIIWQLFDSLTVNYWVQCNWPKPWRICCCL